MIFLKNFMMLYKEKLAVDKIKGIDNNERKQFIETIGKSYLSCSSLADDDLQAITKLKSKSLELQLEKSTIEISRNGQEIIKLVKRKG